MFSTHLLLLLALVLVGLVTAADLYKALEGKAQLRVSTVNTRDAKRFPSVSKHASEADIKKAYKRLSKKYHPDKNSDPGAEDRFVEVAHGEPDPLKTLDLNY